MLVAAQIARDEAAEPVPVSTSEAPPDVAEDATALPLPGDSAASTETHTSAALGPMEVAAPEAEPAAGAESAEPPAPSETATIAEQSGPFLLPGEGDQPAIANAARAAAPNGRAEDAEGFESEDAPPPEDIGGEAPEEVARERRGAARFMRQYKIQEVIKRRQIMLVQVVKEERGTKGAALTTYISLAGRFSVLMPNSPRGGGVSRKITSATDRRRLREVIDELELPEGMSLIVRTAGAQRPKPEIRRDCEYLLRLWDSIRERTLASSAPALIYEEADLIKRSIRDNYARDVEEVLVDGEDAYQEAREFMRMLMPQHAQKVRLYRDGGLFARHGVEAQLDAMHSPVVQLRSGGYVVINQTEALVAIDVNSGRATRERHIEDTALRTNLEAADEIARQLRLRDLAGLVVIDFIDMESSRHDGMVERRLKEALRHDRARIQVGRISHFGLLEMSRQRLRPSLTETTFVACPHCAGRGQVRSIESSALSVLRAIEEEGAKRRAAEIAVHVASPVALYLLNRKRDRLTRIEARFGMSVVFEPDDALSPPALRIDRLRIAEPGPGRAPAAEPSRTAAAALRMDYAPEPEEDEEDETEAPAGDDVADALEGRANGRAGTEAEDGAEDRGTDESGRRRRRRRRRRSGGRTDELEATAGPDETFDEEAEGDGEEAPGDGPSAAADGSDAEAPEDEVQPDEAATATGEAPLPGEAPRRRRRRRGGGGGRGGPFPRAEEDGSEADAPTLPRPAAEPVAPAPRYTGPTPADPFAGHVDDIMAAMEAAEAAAEAAAQAAATLAGSRARLAAPPPTGDALPEPVAVETAEPAPAPALAATEAESAQPEAVASPIVGGEEAAAPAPVALAAAGGEHPAPEPVQGPTVQPRSVDEVAADAPRRSGWWRR